MASVSQYRKGHDGSEQHEPVPERPLREPGGAQQIRLSVWHPKVKRDQGIRRKENNLGLSEQGNKGSVWTFSGDGLLAFDHHSRQWGDRCSLPLPERGLEAALSRPIGGA
jgi:hypothetical protein